MTEMIQKTIKLCREKQHLTREALGEALLGAEQLRLLENGDGREVRENYWLLRILLGRLHYQNATIIFYLNQRDNQLANLETSIRRNLFFWRYGQAEEQLTQFFNLVPKDTPFPFIIYYQLYADLKVRQNKRTKQDADALRQFMDNTMPGFEERLLGCRVFSPEELALITTYYQFIEPDAAEQIKKLFLVTHYLETEYKDMAISLPFYATLMFAYAKCHYEIGEYAGCIKQCNYGLQATEYFRNCEMAAELHELWADASGKLVEQKAALKPPSANLTSQVRTILRHYEIANALYDTFYFGYQENHAGILQEKIKKWKLLLS